MSEYFLMRRTNESWVDFTNILWSAYELEDLGRSLWYMRGPHKELYVKAKKKVSAGRSLTIFYTSSVPKTFLILFLCIIFRGYAN